MCAAGPGHHAFSALRTDHRLQGCIVEAVNDGKAGLGGRCVDVTAVPWQHRAARQPSSAGFNVRRDRYYARRPVRASDGLQRWRDGWMGGWMGGWMDEQNHSERMTKQRKENVVCVYEEGRGGGILT